MACNAAVADKERAKAVKRLEKAREQMAMLSALGLIPADMVDDWNLWKGLSRKIEDRFNGR